MKNRLPAFGSIEEEVRFWETHSLADYWDELEDVRISVELRPEQLLPQIAVLKQRRTTCPVDRSTLLKTVTDYSGWNQGRMLLLRRVPVLECEEHGHRFLTSTTARRIETIFEDYQKGNLQPDDTLAVPVVTLKSAA